MSYYIVDRMGGGEDEDDDPSVSRMLYHLNSFDPDDQEHASVTLVHRESRWRIAVFGSGLLILEQQASDMPPRHMRVPDRQKILCLWKALAAGDIDAVMAEPWAPGYGS
jgi:hypothetical protein